MAQTDVVFDALGNFGPWQAGSLFLIALVKVPAAWQMLSILYLAPSPETLGGTFSAPDRRTPKSDGPGLDREVAPKG